MSIINNVLKDLENKPSSFTPLDAASIAIQQPTHGKPSSAWIGLPLLITATLLLAYLIDFNGLNSELENKKVSQPAVEPLGKTLLSVKSVPVEEQFTKLTGLQINESKNFIELAFQLQSPTTIFLKKKSENSYVFHLKDTTSNIQTPELGNSAWLSKLSLHNVKDGVDILFEIRQGVMVETSNLNKQQQHYWLIRLKKPFAKISEPKVMPEPDKSSPENKSIQKSALKSSDLNDQPEQLRSVPVKLKIKTAAGNSADLQQLNSAIKNYKSSQWTLAEKQFSALLGGTQDRQARLHLVQLYRQLQEKTKLEQLIAKSYNQYSDDVAFKQLYANQLFSNKHYLDLISAFKSDTDNPDILNLLAATYQRTDQHDKAIGHYIKAIKQNPQQPKLWISLGISQQKQGLKADALKSYRKARASGVINDRLKVFLQQRITLLSEN